MMQAIVACPKPVIAAVQGTATAAGCQLVATCDLAVAAETAAFATPGVNIGLFCSTPMVALSRNVSRKRAMEMLLLGEAMSRDGGGRIRPRQSRRAGRSASGARRIALARKIAVEIQVDGRDRQGGILRADRDAARRGLPVRRARHGREHDGSATRKKASAPSSRSARPSGRTAECHGAAADPRHARGRAMWRVRAHSTRRWASRRRPIAMEA